jgi:hypothetical protein
LADCFGELAHKSPELQEEFLYNAETQRTLTKNGATLISALNFFVSAVNTLCNKTMEDTIATVRQYETSRLVYPHIHILNVVKSYRFIGWSGASEASNAINLLYSGPILLFLVYTW